LSFFEEEIGMGSSYDCVQCGKAGKFILGDGKGGTRGYICSNCFNRKMAEEYAVIMPENIPERLSFKSRRKNTHEFDIEFMIVATGKFLTATEIGETKRVIHVWGDFDDDFDEMLKLLEKRIRKSLSMRYIDPKGNWKGNKIAGYVSYNRDREAYDIVIDGKPYSWESIKKNIAQYEGWKIKIELGDIGVNFD
jgi:hypothetical protein